MLRPSRPPQIAVVRLRKGEWVLPKGKPDDGETPRDAAMREVLEETGQAASALFKSGPKVKRQVSFGPIAALSNLQRELVTAC